MAEKKPLIDLIGKLQREAPASAPRTGPRFGELGLLAEIQNLKDALDERQAALDTAAAALADAEAQVSALIARAETAEDAHRAAIDALAIADEAQKALEQQIARRDTEIAKLTGALNKEDDLPAASFAEKAALEAQLATAQAEIERLQDSVSARFREIALLTRRLEEETGAQTAKAPSAAPGKKGSSKKEKASASQAKEAAAPSGPKTASSNPKTPTAKAPARKSAAPKVDPDADEVLFLVRGQLSPLQLVHFLRIVAGLAERGKRTGMWFGDTTWAVGQKSIGYLRKAANIRIHSHLPPLTVPNCIMVQGTESGLILRLLGLQRVIEDGGALAFDGASPPMASTEVALPPQLVPYLETLSAIDTAQDLLVTREAMPGLTQLAPKNLHYVTAPVADGSPGALLIIGRTPSDEDMMDIAILAKSLNRAFRWAVTTPKSALSGYLTSGQADDALKESRAASITVQGTDFTPVPREQLVDNLLKAATGEPTLDTAIQLPVGAHFPFPQIS